MVFFVWVITSGVKSGVNLIGKNENKNDIAENPYKKGGCQVTGDRFLACIMKKFIPNSKLLVIVLRFVTCFSFDKLSIRYSCEEKMFNK